MSDSIWKIADVTKTLKNTGKAFLDGKLLLHFDEEKFFVHIVFTFIIIGAIIRVSLAIEGTMAKEQMLKEELKELEIEKTQRIFDLVTLEKRSEVTLNLKKMGSGVGEPEKRPENLN